MAVTFVAHRLYILLHQARLGAYTVHFALREWRSPAVIREYADLQAFLSFKT